MNDPCPRHWLRYRLNLFKSLRLFHLTRRSTSNLKLFDLTSGSLFWSKSSGMPTTAVTPRWKVSERACLNEVLLPRRPYVTADPTQTEPGVNPPRTYVWTCKRPSSAGFLRAGANSDETTMYLNRKLHREFNKYNLPQGQHQSICIGL